MRVACGAHFHPQSEFSGVVVFVLFLTLMAVAFAVFPSQPCFVWIGVLVLCFRWRYYKDNC
jgi:hypothetical protein